MSGSTTARLTRETGRETHARNRHTNTWTVVIPRMGRLSVCLTRCICCKKFRFGWFRLEPHPKNRGAKHAQEMHIKVYPRCVISFGAVTEKPRRFRLVPVFFSAGAGRCFRSSCLCLTMVPPVEQLGWVSFETSDPDEMGASHATVMTRQMSTSLLGRHENIGLSLSPYNTIDVIS